MISLRAYAKHRQVSPVAVSRAVKSGRLRASVVRDHLGDPKIGDLALADREWEANTDLSRAPAFVKERGLEVAPNPQPPSVQTSAQAPALEAGAPPEPLAPAGDRELSLSEAAAEEKRWKAKIAELEFRRKSAELVDTKDVAAGLGHVFAIVRTRLLAVPSKAKAAMPALTHAEVATLDDLIRQALDELAVERFTSPTSGAAA